MSLSAPKHANYAATVVQLSAFVQLAGCDNVRAAIIFGSSVIVSKDAEIGQMGLFFPVETALSREFLSANNLYRKSEWGNVDQEQKGFFEEHGRVKAMKFRGHKSEGFFIPLSSLNYLGNANAFMKVGDIFDTIDGHEICHKHIPKNNQVARDGVKKSITARLGDNIVDGQFKFHFDTENLRRNAHKILPTDIISITDKWHGTSIVISRPLIKRKLSLVERIASKLGVKVVDKQYGYTYSSRRVIKAAGNGVWTDDIWGVVAREVEDRVPNGFTLYGEIVGFTPDGSPIQGKYTYGCEPYKHKLVIYRITNTTTDNVQIELSWPQLVEFCTKYGLDHVPQIWYGMGKHLLDYDHSLAEWQQKFVQELDHLMVDDRDCPYNGKVIPAEGIVVRIDRLHECESFKLKSFRFLEGESKLLDKGELDLETAQSEEDPELQAA